MPRLPLIICLFLATSISAQETSQLLQNATIIDGTGAAAYKGWLLLEGEQIADVGQGDAPQMTGVEVVDLEGMTILPGLADMHVHLGELAQARWMLKLLLAHGVTRIKESGNRLGNLAAIRNWQETEQAVPRIYYSGVTLNGDGGGRQFLAEGRRTEVLLRDNLAFGVSFIKIHNWVSSQALEQIAQFARTHDLYLTGHVPLGMTSIAALDAGMKILEHVRMRPGEVIDDPEIVARYPLDLIVSRRTLFWADLDRDGEAVNRTLSAWQGYDFFFDPTLAEAEANWDVVETRYGLDYVSPATQADWRENLDRYGDREPDVMAKADAKVAGMLRFVGMAHEHGIKILTGTDTPVIGIVPGISLHRELELLVSAGMTPEEAVHSSTGLASVALRDAETGTLLPGKLADLVIVEGDVSQDITQSRNVRRVILRGRTLDTRALLEEAARFADEHQAATPSL